MRASAKPCALPSVAADSVWHAWSRLDPQHLAWFCRKHFGCNVPHTEARDMAVNMDQALANSLVAARRIEALPVAGASVPGLFSLERRLRMPKGYSYTAAGQQVAFRNMNQRGVAEGWTHVPAAQAPPAVILLPTAGTPVAAAVGAAVAEAAAHEHHTHTTNGSEHEQC